MKYTPPRDIILDLDRLALCGDRITLRDARGRSRRPALSPERADCCGRVRRLGARGAFSVLQRFDVDARRGQRFAEATRDDNPIHFDSDVVPGAMTAARFVMMPELLVPGFAARRLRVKFRALARYDQPTLHRFRVIPTFHETAAPRVDVEFEATQGGQAIASGSLWGEVGPVLPARARSLAQVPAEIEQFFESLQVDPRALFCEPFARDASAAESSQSAASPAGLEYPRAFLASLPSGEMVRQLAGEGGLLNSLDLKFASDGAFPIDGGEPPVVEVERALRPGSAFSKVLTRVVQGVSTFCQGFAMVFLANE